MTQIHHRNPVTRLPTPTVVRSESSVRPESNAQPRRVLLALTYSVLGDAILSVPALRAVRHYWPRAEISLLVGRPVRTLLQGCPYVDEFIFFEPQWREWEPWTNLRLIRILHRRAFDKAILFNRSFHPAFVTATARIPERIGFATDFRSPFLTQRVPHDKSRFEIDSNLDLLNAAGLETEVTAPHLWLTLAEVAGARQCLAGNGVRMDRLLVGMQPGCNSPKRREWGAERFAVVADRLTRELGAQVVFLGAGRELPVSRRAAEAMQTRPVVLTGETSLRQALAVIAQCDLWVGNDAGLLHAAVALGPATVGIFGPTKFMQWGHQGPRHRSLVVDPTVRWRSVRTLRSCLDAIPPSAVFDAAVEVLRESPTARGKLPTR